MKILKKLLSVFMSLCTMFLIPIGKVNADEFVNIMVVCKDDKILRQFCEYVKKYKYIFRTGKVVEHQCGYACVKYGELEREVIIHPIYFGDVLCSSDIHAQEILSKLENSCQVVILYDISDGSLDDIVRDYSKIESDNWLDLLNIDTFLNKCINLSMSEKWFKSLNFFTYDGSGLLSEEERERRKEALNFYTCTLEHKFDIDNRWGRGHADYLECSKSFFCSFAGNLDTFNRFKMDEKKKKTNKATTITPTRGFVRNHQHQSPMHDALSTKETTLLNKKPRQATLKKGIFSCCKKSESEQEYL